MEMLLGSVGPRRYNRHGLGGVLSYLSSGIFEHLMSPFSIEQQRGARHRDIPATIVAWTITALVIAGLVFILYHTETRGSWEYIRKELGW